MNCTLSSFKCAVVTVNFLAVLVIFRTGDEKTKELQFFFPLQVVFKDLLENIPP